MLLIYPQLGQFDNILRDIPLSLIYAATHSVKNGYRVKILDCRLHPQDYFEKIDQELKHGCFLVGLSVMTGNPIRTSLKISKYIKQKYDVPIVWGGPHPTILPEQTLESKYIDFVIRDWGSEPMYKLISHLKDGAGDIDGISGLGFKKDGRIVLNAPTQKFEIIDYKDIPYQLVDIDSDNYNRLHGNITSFPIYTSIGCPCKCSFCMSPVAYKKINGKKWVPFEVDSIIEHIGFLEQQYRFKRLQIYDDNSFVHQKRMQDFFNKYIDHGFHERLTIDFRGARIDQIDKMDDDFLELLVKANVGFLEIGVESGSDNVLKLMKKGISLAQILRVSEKLSRYPSLKPHYNILCGIPGETYEDLIQTKRLMVHLADENPECLLGAAADWKPLPGSEMTATAVEMYGLVLPDTLEGWADIDTTDAKKIKHPWYTKKTDNYIKLLQISGQLLDSKLDLLESEMSKGRKIFIFQLAIKLAKLYRYILKLRLKYDYAGLLIEYHIRNIMIRIMSGLSK